MSRFDRNLLGALDALLSECNVTRAAERLGVTQPTMSGKLQRLRYQFDDELLVRKGRDMELTPFALSLIGPVHQAIEDIESLFRGEPGFNASSSRRAYRIMATDDCLSPFMPLLISRLAAIAPNVGLSIEAADGPVDKLLSDEIDLCISSDNPEIFFPMICEGSLQSELLFSDEYVCVVDAKHALHEGSTVEDFLSFPHVIVKQAEQKACTEVEAIRQYAADYNCTYHVPSFSLVPSMVARTNLIGLIPKRLAKICASAIPVRTFAPPIAMPSVEVFMVWRTRRHEDEGHRWLRQTLLKERDLWCGNVATIVTKTSRSPRSIAMPIWQDSAAVRAPVLVGHS